jgi:hypothetical protein
MQTKNQVEITMEPGRPHEECMDLRPVDLLHYSFQATRPVQFNIHYHEGATVGYPVKKDNISADKGTFTPDRDQFYCMMWTNSQSGPVNLSYEFTVGKK